jgi:hypothetical protein
MTSGFGYEHRSGFGRPIFRGLFRGLICCALTDEGGHRGDVSVGCGGIEWRGRGHIRVEGGLGVTGQALFDDVEVLQLRLEKIVEGAVGFEGVGWNRVSLNGGHQR